ncbi:hypothetical protein [Nostoc sp. NMS9]|uniref:hypothetical protein n=1 Tax=Nostoc sp. NMS9 TaxID=2815393 RepID=UPI0025F1452F|nr:hypothetical protein [Nostoc sp. NMS9]MBN3943502.1 hypothetical protein [Nostoc sp. NMS9]
MPLSNPVFAELLLLASFTHWHDESSVIAGAALVSDYSSTNPYGITSYQPSNAVGDSFSFDIFVEAGTYDVTFLGHAYTNRGLASISVNGTLQYSDLDFYGFNTIVKLNRSIVIPVTGRNTITVTVVGKNSGSSAFYITLTKVWGIKV